MWTPFSKLTEAQASQASVGRHAAGRGLWLCRAQDGETHWEVSLTVRGECRDLRIGGYPELSVRQAKVEAAKWRGLTRRGLDPEREQEEFRNAAARNLDQFYS